MVNKRKNILFTFDYELFLGSRSGTVNECTLSPTAKILSILEEYHISAIFFVDTLWLIRLKEIFADNLSAKNDYENVVAQLQQITKSGHYVFNHLHPHWLDARYIKEVNEWELGNYARYRFTILNKESKDSLFIKTTQLLNEILCPANNAYIADGYRAGGWSLQPFEDFKPYFEKYGIKYDFSVLPGMKSTSSTQQYDFSQISIAEPYSFSDDPCIPTNGAFTEFPISFISISFVHKLLNKILLKYLWKTGDHYLGDGKSIFIDKSGENQEVCEMASIELLTWVKLPVYLKLLDRNKYMQFISHPKMLSAHNINTFARFMKKAFSRYTIETDFRKMLPH